MMKNTKNQQIQFTKMHGLGNDFAVFDGRKEDIKFTGFEIQKMSNRHTGIGFDQLLTIKQAKKGGHAYIEIYNANGQEVASCGNGIRCVASLIMKELNINEVSLETLGSTAQAKHAENDQISVNMGQPKLKWSEIPLKAKNNTTEVNLVIDNLPKPVAVNMGNPHIIFFVDNVNDIEIMKLGPIIENHPLFPEKTNVEFAEVLDRMNVRMQVWERGSGRTMACGTGACAVGVASILRGLTEHKVKIELDGGYLFIEWNDKKDVIMTGPTSVVFTGLMTQSLL
jgi:diaminopimelate epimerase